MRSRTGRNGLRWWRRCPDGGNGCSADHHSTRAYRNRASGCYTHDVSHSNSANDDNSGYPGTRYNDPGYRGTRYNDSGYRGTRYNDSGNNGPSDHHARHIRHRDQFDRLCG